MRLCRPLTHLVKRGSGKKGHPLTSICAAFFGTNRSNRVHIMIYLRTYNTNTSSKQRQKTVAAITRWQTPIFTPPQAQKNRLAPRLCLRIQKHLLLLRLSSDCNVAKTVRSNTMHEGSKAYILRATCVHTLVPCRGNSIAADFLRLNRIHSKYFGKC
jgi:hypothetical protein